MCINKCGSTVGLVLQTILNCLDKFSMKCSKVPAVFPALFQIVPELTISPLPGGWVDDSKELVVGHSLWVQVGPYWFTLHDLVSSLQGAHHLTLPSAGVPNDKNRMSHSQQLLQLDNLWNQ